MHAHTHVLYMLMNGTVNWILQIWAMVGGSGAGSRWNYVILKFFMQNNKIWNLKSVRHQ